MKQEDYVTPEGEWTSPVFDVPEQGEIVVIACDIEVKGKKKPAKILQTAIYQQTKDGKEIWHCQQPFVLLRWWLRLPKVPESKIIPMGGTLLGGRS